MRSNPQPLIARPLKTLEGLCTDQKRPFSRQTSDCVPDIMLQYPIIYVRDLHTITSYYASLYQYVVGEVGMNVL